jgi:hypothetical protein
MTRVPELRLMLGCRERLHREQPIGSDRLPEAAWLLHRVVHDGKAEIVGAFPNRSSAEHAAALACEYDPRGWRIDAIPLIGFRLQSSDDLEGAATPSI